jgi:hypothetical protein
LLGIESWVAGAQRARTGGADGGCAVNEAIESGIWLRLARLDTCCELRVFSTAGGDPPRVWVAEMHNRHEPSRDPLRVSAAKLRQVLLQAVLLAEAQGWMARVAVTG